MASASPICDQLDRFFRFSELPIVDVRDRDSYALGHFVGSGHFPLSELSHRMYQLPKRAQLLRLVAEESQLEKAQATLTKMGYRVSSMIIWNDKLTRREQLPIDIESGEDSCRLWQPAPIVERFVKTYLPDMPGNRALDIGCGAGRDAVYLALQGLEVSAVDYRSDALDKLKLLAESHRVNVEGYQIDLESTAEPLVVIGGEFDLILVVRYLHRPLLPMLLDKLRPGGFIVYQTFMRGCEAFGRPKNLRFLLKPGELAEAFAQCKIRIDKVELLSDGRPTNVFIAQKALAT